MNSQLVLFLYHFEEVVTLSYHLMLADGGYEEVPMGIFEVSEANRKAKSLEIKAYDNRWSGAFMQTHGKMVVPTVGWVKPDTYDICFSGLRDGGVFLISTLGVNNSICYPYFIDGYREMRRRFPSTQIISVGDRLEGMDDDVCYVRYEDSFGSWDRHQDWWQPKLFNWDMSIPKGE